MVDSFLLQIKATGVVAKQKLNDRQAPVPIRCWNSREKTDNSIDKRLNRASKIGVINFFYKETYCNEESANDLRLMLFE
jgi:hypothetical protein